MYMYARFELSITNISQIIDINVEKTEPTWLSSRGIASIIPVNMQSR